MLTTSATFIFNLHCFIDLILACGFRRDAPEAIEENVTTEVNHLSFVHEDIERLEELLNQESDDVQPADGIYCHIIYCHIMCMECVRANLVVFFITYIIFRHTDESRSIQCKEEKCYWSKLMAIVYLNYKSSLKNSQYD